MLVILNQYAGGGTAEKKWRTLEPSFRRAAGPFTLVERCSEAPLRQTVADALSRGESDFVAAGGDGTINSLVNVLGDRLTQGPSERVRLGAIGLGSSNDFHKPFCPEQRIEGVPAKIDFHRASPRDVGCLTLSRNGTECRLYFLINASVGVTANANALFNNPDAVLKALKRWHTPLAILYAALRTIAGHTNLHVLIESEEVGSISAGLSNLGIVKNPYFSGSLHYGDPARYDNGRFAVHLYSGMSRTGLVSLLFTLTRGTASSPHSRSWSTRSLTVSAENEFAVEYDGEVAHASKACFTILPRCLDVCQ